MGLTAAYLWQRYHRIKLPPYLAFFGGRRFVPIITAFAAIVLAVLMGLVYPAVRRRPDAISASGSPSNDVIGGFVYGTLNRLLIPLGLHHILNSGPWFVIGDVQRRRRRGRTATSPRFLTATRPPARS